jgi:hypothetical protein
MNFKTLIEDKKGTYSRMYYFRWRFVWNSINC